MRLPTTLERETTTPADRLASAIRRAWPVAILLAACSKPPVTPDVLAPSAEDPYLTRSPSTGAVHLRPEVCRNVPENMPEERKLDESALVSFLEHQGYQTKTSRERADLVYVDVRSNDQETVRLHVAILEDAHAAGQNLDRALSGRGEGAWGVHRSNLAVLSPLGTPRQAVDFAARTKLACWGVLTIADGGTDFVVPGGYMEF